MGTDFAGQVEIDRWVMIDKQLFGLMSVFGNGVISGWTVAAYGSFEVSISPGYGNINYLAARTEFPDSVSNLPPNSINYIYARAKSRTRFAEDVEFIASQDGGLTDPNCLLISEVTTGASAIESINDSVRQDIGFLDIINDEIKQHKHRGGSQNPSKIDLSSEVTGQLPGYRISDFDASKITTGTFDLERMPPLDHQDLMNVGLLTHPQLDTFVKTLESSNKELFGEISTANLLQMILALKYIYDDPSSVYYLDNKRVDQYMINEVAIIPGITPDSRIDFNNTTATVNLDDHYIEGTSPQGGTSFYVRYDTDAAWNSAYSTTNIVIANDSASLSFSDEEDPSIVTIEAFEGATSPNQILSGTDNGGSELFKKQTVVISDNAAITANSVALDAIEGFYSGKFSTQQAYRVQYVKEFSSEQDWTSYDSFVLYTKCLDAVHGAVRLFFYDSESNLSPEFNILEQNEVTSNSNPSSNGFEPRVIDIGQISFREAIKGFVIYSDDTTNPFHFFIDHINIQRAVLLPEEGKIVLRYSTSNSVCFSTIDWQSSEPTGTEVLIRARTANGTVFLSRSEYTPYLQNGDLLNLNGTDIEIEITLNSDTSRLLAPSIQELRLLIFTVAEIDGYTIDSYDELIRGSTENVEISESTASVAIETPISVGSYYFALGNSINQVVETTSEITEDKYTASELAIFGNNSPISPNQIFKAVEDSGSRAKASSACLFDPKSVVRLSNKNFVIADTYNDRILEYDPNGSLVTGIGSINYQHSDKLFPISACLDIRSGILYVVWSKKISFKTVDVRKITIHNTTQSVQIKLSKDSDKINGLTTSELESISAEGQILTIHLSLQNLAIVQNMGNENAYIFISSDAISIGIDTDSVIYKAVATSFGLPLFIGNFAYIDGIFSPTYANKTESDGFTVANATVGIKQFQFTGIEETLTYNGNVSPIIEIDKNNNIIYGSDKMLFSPFVPGRVQKIDDITLLVGGLRPNGQQGSVAEEDFNFRSIDGAQSEKLRRKSVLNTMFFDGNPAFVGAVIVLDTRNNSTSFEYISPEGLVVSDCDIDPINGYFIIAESSFKKSGRIIKVDSLGNIVFCFGEGMYGIINDISSQPDGSIVVST